MMEQQAQWDYPELTRGNLTSTVGGALDKLDKSRSLMPYYWNSDDTRRAVIAALIPAGAGLVGAAALSQDASFNRLLETTRRPHWAPKNHAFYSTLDVATTLPLGYASYLVYKYGGGFDYTDTTIALSVYGANLALALVSVPLIKNRNLKGLFFNTTLVHLAASATAFAFYKIDKTAGYLALPWVLWTGFYTYFTHSVCDLNNAKLD
ncbi:TspO/MBR family protein [Aphelenchoides besseyi]|nr:TspO/MBR family protein [Aphelenchoides besseyi]KAI6207617.1 TspO/MBR family protein [Aphelenchoides besseyi]